VGSRKLAQAALVLAGIMLLTLSAKLQIPLWPVPMTMQTYVVLVIGFAFGPTLGLLTVAGYVAVGALGLPVFAGTPGKGIGLPYMLGPTGGYLLGFVAAAGLLGKLAERGWDRGWLKSLAAMTIGHALILACGVAWLGVLTGFERALALGLYPFVFATIFKTVLAAITLPLAWRLAKRFR
jgi:biotin transport system substrate-specific component